MQRLDTATADPSDDLEFASMVIETVLLAMRAIGCQMRAHRPRDLTVSQFHVLAFLSRHEGASLSRLAEHRGLTLPSTSKAVDCLVRQGFVEREVSPADRRRVALRLTEHGRRTFREMEDATRRSVADVLACICAAERAQMTTGLEVLRRVFAAHRSACGQRG